jgi:hypothetical protein
MRAAKTTSSGHSDARRSPKPAAQGEDKTETAGEWLYVYLLLEFQSSNDTYMAVRILTYIGLLYQDLIKSGQTSARKLPAVFPLVLYNGERPWSAAREMEELIEPVPQSLAAYRPRLRYFVMDEGRVPEVSFTNRTTPLPAWCNSSAAPARKK